MAEDYYNSSLTGDEIESRLLGAVVYNATQVIPEDRRVQARRNIGAMKDRDVDSLPRGGSTNLITSGGVYDAMGGVFSPTKLATPGALVHFEDGAYKKPLEALRVKINPVQSGTGDPSPDNVRPITGWTGAKVKVAGKNLLRVTAKSSTIDGVKFTVNSDGSVRVQGTTTSASCSFNLDYINSATASIPAGTWKFGCNSNNPNVALQISNESRAIGSVEGNEFNSLTVPNSRYSWSRIRIWGQGTVVDTTVYPMRCSNDEVDATFEPYKGTTYPISFGSAGTVYDGTMDVVSGELSTRPYYASYNGETLVGPWISSMDAYVPGSTPTIGAQVVDMGGTITSYQLTPTEVLTLLGENNIWADTGEIEELAYRADIGLYLVDALNPIKELIANREASMKATKNYVTGDYIIVGNTFYKVLTSIANGTSLTVNGNVRITTVGAELQTALQN